MNFISFSECIKWYENFMKTLFKFIWNMNAMCAFIKLASILWNNQQYEKQSSNFPMFYLFNKLFEIRNINQFVFRLRSKLFLIDNIFLSINATIELELVSFGIRVIHILFNSNYLMIMNEFCLFFRNPPKYQFNTSITSNLYLF